MANSGSLISLITGGAVNPRFRRDKHRERRDERREATGLPEKRVKAGSRKPGQGPVRRMLKMDVLCLIIVNMPSVEGVANAKEEIEKTQVAKDQSLAN